MDNIRERMARGALWTVAFNLVERSLGLISTLILARVLVPEDFGIVAMAMSFVALLELMTAFGFDVTLIHKQTQDQSHWNTAWTFNVLLGLAVAAVMVLLADQAGKFYHHPELADVIRVLAVGSLVQGFENIGIVAFRTEMRFDREFRFRVTKKLAGFLVTIPAAIILDSYWALVMGQIAGRLVGAAMSYWVHPYRPRLTLSAARELLNFSRWVFLVNLVGYFKERSPDWIIGRIGGAHDLGVFNLSAEIAAMPSTELVAPINRAVFPAYAKLANDPPRLRAEYLSVMAVIVMIAVPAVTGLAATAPLLVPVILGPNWTDASPLLMLLAFYGLTQLVQSNAQAAYLALGRPDVPAKVNVVHVCIKVAAMIALASAFGLIGAAVANLVTAIIMIPVSLGTAFRLMKVRVRDFVAEIWRPFVAAASMYAVVLALVKSVLANLAANHSIVALAAAVTIGAVIYVGLLAALWCLAGTPEGAEAVALRRIRAAVQGFTMRRQVST